MCVEVSFGLLVSQCTRFVQSFCLSVGLSVSSSSSFCRAHSPSLSLFYCCNNSLLFCNPLLYLPPLSKVSEQGKEEQKKVNIRPLTRPKGTRQNHFGVGMGGPGLQLGLCVPLAFWGFPFLPPFGFGFGWSVSVCVLFQSKTRAHRPAEDFTKILSA
jgi:hypothetical protein